MDVESIGELVGNISTDSIGFSNDPPLTALWSVHVVLELFADDDQVRPERLASAWIYCFKNYHTRSRFIDNSVIASYTPTRSVNHCQSARAITKINNTR